MRVRHFTAHKQQPFYLNRRIFLALVLLCLTALSGCRRTSEELPVLPPTTHPLSREYIGYGVVNVSFAHLLSSGGPEGVSLGYVRRGTVVRIVERRRPDNLDTWVFAEANYGLSAGISSGWLPETALEIYESESRANTASKTMGP